MRREGVTLVWHLLFLGSVTREAGGTKEKNQSPGDARKGLLWGGRWPVSAARPGEKKQGPEHKTSQIDLSLHEEERAKRLHYHARHTLRDDRVPATYQVPAAPNLHN